LLKQTTRNKNKNKYKTKQNKQNRRREKEKEKEVYVSKKTTKLLTFTLLPMLVTKKSH